MLCLPLLGHRGPWVLRLWGELQWRDRAGGRNKEEKKCSSSGDTQCRETQSRAENLKQSLAAPRAINVEAEGTAEALGLSWVQ